MNKLLTNINEIQEGEGNGIPVDSLEMQVIQNEIDSYEENAEKLEVLGSDIENQEEMVNSDNITVMDVANAEASLESFSIFFTGQTRSKVISVFNMESFNQTGSNKQILEANLKNKKQLYKLAKTAHESLGNNLSDLSKKIVKESKDVPLYVKIQDISLNSNISFLGNIKFIDFLKTNNPLRDILKIDAVLDLIMNAEGKNNLSEDYELITTADIGSVEKIVSNLSDMKKFIDTTKISQDNKNLIRTLSKSDFVDDKNFIFLGPDYANRIKTCMMVLKRLKPEMTKYLKPSEYSILELALKKIDEFNSYIYLYVYANFIVGNE